MNDGQQCVLCLAEGVDGQNDQLGLRLCMVDEVQVDKLLQFYICRLHALDNVGKERADVAPSRHVGNDTLDGFLLQNRQIASKVLSYLVDLSCTICIANKTGAIPRWSFLEAK